MQVLLFLAPRGLALRRGFRAPCSCAIASIRRPARNAFERALRAAWRSRTQARLAVSRALEAAEAWDPGSFDASRSIYTDAEAWRLQAMAADPNSCLRRARIQARSALSLAARPGEASRAETLLVLIEHEAGLHGRELRDAVALAKLQPHNPDALALLKRARHCNRLEE